MKVSVVIPTYFRQEDLSEVLDCLLTQTFKPFEVIIVDDTPTKDIEETCGDYKVRFADFNINLIYLRNLRERSLTIARNMGVGKATGDVILFLDSDVILFEDFIEKIVDVFKEKPHALGVEGYMLNIEARKGSFIGDLFNRVFHTYYRYPKDSCRLFEYPVQLTKIIECEWMSGAAFACRQEVFNDFKFDENLKGYSFMEDVLFSHLIFKKYPGKLFITPYARYIHKLSPKYYEKSDALERLKKRCRKYVLKKLFGFKGVLLYYRQDLGELILKAFRLVKNLAFSRNF